MATVRPMDTATVMVAGMHTLMTDFFRVNDVGGILALSGHPPACRETAPKIHKLRQPDRRMDPGIEAGSTTMEKLGEGALE
ncbi:hypothetical protein GCM10009077_36910 [Roseibium denhamense]